MTTSSDNPDVLTGPDWLDRIKWNQDGLVAVIVQDFRTDRVLMMAWMNAEAIELSVRERRAIFWSRSRQQLWRKGEQSGNVQYLKGIFLDCDADALLIKVEQIGGVACHTGRESCFYRQLVDDRWVSNEPVLIDPAKMYGTPND
jgi:phosphoribosyl-AMP cyclohydrolase